MSEINTPLNEWATSGTKTEPTAPKRAEGWLLEEKPAFENFNWQWAEWVDRFNFLYKNPSQSYNAATDYNGAGQLVRGSNSMLYVSVQSSGPASTVQDPTTDVGDVFWELLSSFLNLGTAAAANLGTGVGNVPTYAASQFLTGNVTGSATKWQTARTITMTGEVSGSVAFDGSANFNLNVNLPNAGSMFGEDSGTANGEFRTNVQNDGRFVVGQAGTADANFRTNLQNDGRFRQIVTPLSVWTGSSVSVNDTAILADTGFVVVPGTYFLSISGDATISISIFDTTTSHRGSCILNTDVSDNLVLVVAGRSLTGNFTAFGNTQGSPTTITETITAIHFVPF